MCRYKNCKRKEYLEAINKCIDSFDDNMSIIDFIGAKNLFLVSLDKICGCKSKKKKRATAK